MFVQSSDFGRMLPPHVLLLSWAIAVGHAVRITRFGVMALCTGGQNCLRDFRAVSEFHTCEVARAESS